MRASGASSEIQRAATHVPAASGEPATYAGSLRLATETLCAAGVPTARLDAEVLLAAAAGFARSTLYARFRDPVPNVVGAAFRDLVARRCCREPVAYITGRQEFWSLPFAVDPSVLIPRPETELLVEVAQELLGERRNPLICDVGTGSGCIAVALAVGPPRPTVVALDLSEDALSMARRNVTRHGLQGRVHLTCGDALDSIRRAAPFDLIVSNPPYVGSEETVTPEVRWEPEGAVRAGREGLDAIVRLLDAAPRYLKEGGCLVMEFGSSQETAVARLARAAGFQTVSIRRDLAGLPRVLVAGDAATDG